MARLILPSKYTQQPQQAVGIDWANPITRGLIAVIHPGSKLDLISGRPLTINPATTFGYGTSGYYAQSTDFGQGGVYLTSPLIPTTLSAASMLTVIERTGAVTGNGNSLINIGDAWHAPYDNWSLYADSSPQIRDSAGGGWSLYPVVLGKKYVFLNTISASSSSVFYDGKKDTEVFRTIPAITTTNQLAWLNIAGDTNSSRGQPFKGYLALYWNRKLSDAEAIEVTKNPWQIFKAASRNIPALTPVAFVPPSIVVGAIVRKKVSQQPQQASGVNWANPITRGLRVAEIGSINGVNLATRKQSTIYGVLGSVATSKGRSPLFTANTYIETPVGDWGTDSTASLTLMVLVHRTEVSAATWSKGIFYKNSAAGNTYFGITGVYGSGRIAAVTGVNRSYENNASESNEEPLGSVTPYVVRVSNSSMELWKNGAFQSNTATGSFGTFSGFCTTGVDSQDANTRVWTGGIPVRLAWDRKLSDAEVRSICENPWQVLNSVSQVGTKYVETPYVAPAPLTGGMTKVRSGIKTQQPYSATSIDWSNSLTRGLVFLAIPGQPELVTGISARKNPSGSIGVGKSGALFSTVQDASPPFYYPLPYNAPLYSVTTQNTVMFKGAFSADMSYSQILSVPFAAGSWNAPYSSFGVDKKAGGVTSVVDGVESVFVITQNGTVQSPYRDGIFRYSDPIAGTALNWNTHEPVCLMNATNSFAVSAGFIGQMSVVAIWNRALTPTEVKAVSENPWQLFKRQDRKYWVETASAVGSPLLRALLLRFGYFSQVTDAQVGKGEKPVVLLNGAMQQRAASEGAPIILDNGKLRTLAAGETLLL